MMDMFYIPLISEETANMITVAIMVLPLEVEDVIEINPKMAIHLMKQ
jgi:hypothetical protein